MKTSQAEAAFAALSQATRLAILRYLIKSGSEGVPAGVIADTLDIQPSTFSFHVAILTRARLVQARREQRQILYSPDFNGIRAVVEFLLKARANPGAKNKAGLDALQLAKLYQLDDVASLLAPRC